MRGLDRWETMEQDRHDAREEARREGAADDFDRVAATCRECGERWDVGTVRATRLQPAEERQPECPHCGGERRGEKPVLILIPVEGPLEEIEYEGLDQMQHLVGDENVEQIPIPAFIAGAEACSLLVNEEGRRLGLEPNMRATDFLVPGIGLFMGDVVRGPVLLVGVDPDTGEADEVPPGIRKRARLIEREARA